MPSTVGGRWGIAPNNRSLPPTGARVVEHCACVSASPVSTSTGLTSSGAARVPSAVRSAGGQPRLGLAEQRPDRAMMFRLVRFEVEIQRDERPAGAIAGLQRLLDDRPDAFEEILAKGRLLPVIRLPV